MKKGKPIYLEPAEYFPISIRKKYKLGEYAEKCDSKVDAKVSKEKKKGV